MYKLSELPDLALNNKKYLYYARIRTSGEGNYSVIERRHRSTGLREGGGGCKVA